MILVSHDLREGEKLPQRQVFNGMGYEGDNLSPHLAWDEVPPGTKSFVVTCFDPDAPTGSGWWHWVVANLPADTRVLPQGAGSGIAALPEGAVQTRTDFGKAGYGGAAISLPSTRWMWNASTLTKTPAARWLALTSISIRSAALQLRPCSANRIAGMYCYIPALILSKKPFTSVTALFCAAHLPVSLNLV